VKLATFTHGGTTRVGVVVGDEVVDVSRAAPELPRAMEGILAAGPSALERIRAVAGGGPRFALAQLKLEAPCTQPRKFLAIGLNYADHIAETGRPAPEFPVFFNKQNSCVNGPYDPIWMPRVSDKLDYEGELAFVIGRRARHVPKERAHEVIGGYLVCDDVSVRDWQFKAPTMTLGKSFDTHGPIGPWVVTKDEIPDPQKLAIRTWVNGELLQDGNTKDMVYDCAQQIEHLSTAFTLEPGDIISTGTPAGVGIVRKPPVLLKAGDVVRVEVERVGVLENPVIEEPADNVLL
jgi:2-keto-4-pentenoate hydratase/2-oxohepta-3-ene-1,7-dioic acid hydratase in catechol pathway